MLCNVKVKLKNIAMMNIPEALFPLGRPLPSMSIFYMSENIKKSSDIETNYLVNITNSLQLT